LSSTHSFHGWNSASTTAATAASTPPTPRITHRVRRRAAVRGLDSSVSNTTAKICPRLPPA
jgi:hypothetical protein